MDAADSFRLRGNRGLNQLFVDVQRVLTDVDENRHAAAQHKGVSRRDERVGWHDDFIARLNVTEKRRHLQCRSPRVDEEELLATELFLH